MIDYNVLRRLFLLTRSNLPSSTRLSAQLNLDPPSHARDIVVVVIAECGDMIGSRFSLVRYTTPAVRAMAFALFHLHLWAE